MYWNGFAQEQNFLFSEWRILTPWTIGKTFIFSLDKKLSESACFDFYY